MKNYILLELFEILLKQVFFNFPSYTESSCVAYTSPASRCYHFLHMLCVTTLYTCYVLPLCTCAVFFNCHKTITPNLAMFRRVTNTIFRAFEQPTSYKIQFISWHRGGIMSPYIVMSYVLDSTINYNFIMKYLKNNTMD